MTKKRGRPAKAADGQTKYTWDTRHARAKALKAETDLKVRQGELIEKRQFQDWAAKACFDLKEHIQDLKARLPDMLAHKEVRAIDAILTRELDRGLRNFAEHVKAGIYDQPFEQGAGI